MTLRAFLLFSQLFPSWTETVTSPSLLPQLWTTTVLLSVCINLTALGTWDKWNHQYLCFCVWLISLCIMSSRFIHIVSCLRISIWSLNNITLFVYIIFISSSINGHLGYFSLLAIVNNAAMDIGVQVLLKSLFSTSLGIYLGMELLGHMIILYLTFWGTSILFFAVVVPFCIPIHNVWGFQFLYILKNTCYFLFICFFLIIIILMDMKWYLTVVVIYLMTRAVEHLFMCLLAICVFSLEKYLSTYFTHF